MSHFTCLKLLFLWSLSFWENAHLRALTSIAQDIFIEIELRRDLKWEITQWHSPSVGICKIATCRFPNAKMKVFFTHIRIFRRYEWTCEGRGKKRHFGMRCDFLKQIVNCWTHFAKCLWPQSWYHITSIYQSQFSTASANDDDDDPIECCECLRRVSPV